MRIALVYISRSTSTRLHLVHQRAKRRIAVFPSAEAEGGTEKVKKKLTVPASANPGFYYVIVEVVASDAKPRNNVSASKYTIQVY